MRYVRSAKKNVFTIAAVTIGLLVPAVVFADAASPAPTAAPQQQPPNIDVPFALPATFQGVTACADCPGIRVTITLNTDGSYNLEREYLERPARSAETGRWAYDRAKSLLTLAPAGGGSPEFFALSLNPTLQALDAQGKPIPASANFTYAPWLTFADTPLPLESTAWRLAELGDRPVSANNPNPISLQFDAVAKRISGSGGCNRISGPYEASGQKLHIGPIAATRMACPQPIMDTETAFVQALGSVTSYKIDGNTLSLFSASGSVLAQLSGAK